MIKIQIPKLIKINNPTIIISNYYPTRFNLYNGSYFVKKYYYICY